MTFHGEVEYPATESSSGYYPMCCGSENRAFPKRQIRQDNDRDGTNNDRGFISFRRGINRIKQLAKPMINHLEFCSVRGSK